jgi:hypothetical protein
MYTAEEMLLAGTSMFCKVTQETIIIIIINENNTNLIVVAHIAHLTQNLMSHYDSTFISPGLSTDQYLVLCIFMWLSS